MARALHKPHDPPAKNPDLHGQVPSRSALAVVLVDVISDFAFPDAEKLFPRALRAAGRIRKLKLWAHRHEVPVIYANDNYGRWRSDFRRLVGHCLEDGTRGEPITRLLLPGEDDYFVLKPKHSAFYSTTLDTLLKYLGAKTLVIAGFASNLCVLFTACDAYLRDFEVLVPRDAIAANTPADDAYVRRHLETVLGIDMRPTAKLMARFSRRGLAVSGHRPNRAASGS